MRLLYASQSSFGGIKNIFKLGHSNKFLLLALDLADFLFSEGSNFSNFGRRLKFRKLLNLLLIGGYLVFKPQSLMLEGNMGTI